LTVELATNLSIAHNGHELPVRSFRVPPQRI
jgi:hypothetical protein